MSLDLVVVALGVFVFVNYQIVNLFLVVMVWQGRLVLSLVVRALVVLAVRQLVYGDHVVAVLALLVQDLIGSLLLAALDEVVADYFDSILK